jgi:tRNA (mo5U34)-methyltransferase
MGVEGIEDADVGLSEREAESVLRRAEYWHYPFDLPWGHVAASKVHHQERHQLRRQHFFEPLLRAHGGSLAGRRVLDLGCCQGFWSFEAARAGADACLGLDSSPAFIDEARALRIVLGVGNCAFRRAHLEDDDWGRDLQPFDVTLFLGLFYHLTDPVHVLRRAMALTRETIVVDTEVRPADGAVMVLVGRDLGEPTTAGSRLSSKLRVLPSTDALLALLADGGFGACEVLKPAAGMPEEYLNGQRISILARRIGDGAEGPVLSDPSGQSAARPAPRSDAQPGWHLRVARTGRALAGRLGRRAAGRR